MSIERREFVRQRVSRVEVRVASQEAFRASYLRDLSMGGLFVRSRQPLAKGTAVVVELVVENQPPRRLRGEVMRQEHAPDGTARGFGVQFSTVDAETRAALAAIISAHHQPEAPPAAERADLETRLSEARGTIEAYEESMASIRESETGALQRLEASQAECSVLMKVSHELQARVQALEVERTELRSRVDSLAARLTRGDAELKAEVQTLRDQLAGTDEVRLRAELQDFAAQLDDERLKSMALERALQRFIDMGGVIPPRKA